MHGFEKVPKVKFLIQLFLPLAACFELAFLGTGLFVPNPGGLDPHWAARAQQERVFRVIAGIPPYCLYGEAPSEFQQMQCGVLWRKLARDAAFVAIPFVFVLVVYLIAQDSLVLTYKRARKKLAEGKAAFSGTITNPTRLRTDLYN
jgi:hypothetical protein